MADIASTAPRPVPQADSLSLPFFEALGRRVLAVQRCANCGTCQIAERRCNKCRSERLDWHEATGRASLHSFVIIHMNYHPAFPPPYNAAIVELEEGPRIYSNIIGCEHARLRVGMRLRAGFRAHGDAWLPVFRPLDTHLDNND